MDVVLLGPLRLCVYGTLLVIVLLMLRKLLLKTLPKRVMCAMWLVVFARFVVPWGLAVPIEVPANRTALSLAAEAFWKFGDVPDESAVGTLDSGQSSLGALPQAQSEAPSDWVGPLAGISIGSAGPAGDSLGIEDVIAAVWIIGSTVALLRFVFLYVYGRCRYKDAREVDDRRAKHWLAARSHRCQIRLVSSTKIDGPMAYGIVCPTIAVPADFDWGDWPRARLVLEHEYAHIVRLDVLKKMLALAVACLYWFNPFVWMALAYFTRDLELACDEAVVRRCTPGRKKAYAHLILDIAQEHATGRRGLAARLGAGSLEERIVSIMSIDMKVGRAKQFCAGLAVVALTGMAMAVPGLVVAQGTSQATTPLQMVSAQEGTASQVSPADAVKESALNLRLSEVIDANEGKSLDYGPTGTLTDTSLTISSSAWSLTVPRESVDSAIFKEKGEQLFYENAGQNGSIECALRLPLADGTVVEVYCAASDGVVWSDYLGEKVKVGKVGTQDGLAVMVGVYTQEDLRSEAAQSADSELLESLWYRAASWVSLPA